MTPSEFLTRLALHFETSVGDAFLARQCRDYAMIAMQSEHDERERGIALRSEKRTADRQAWEARRLDRPAASGETAALATT